MIILDEFAIKSWKHYIFCLYWDLLLRKIKINIWSLRYWSKLNLGQIWATKDGCANLSWIVCANTDLLRCRNVRAIKQYAISHEKQYVREIKQNKTITKIFLNRRFVRNLLFCWIRRHLIDICAKSIPIHLLQSLHLNLILISIPTISLPLIPFKTKSTQKSNRERKK